MSKDARRAKRDPSMPGKPCPHCRMWVMPKEVRWDGERCTYCLPPPLDTAPIAPESKEDRGYGEEDRSQGPSV